MAVAAQVVRNCRRAGADDRYRASARRNRTQQTDRHPAPPPSIALCAAFIATSRSPLFPGLPLVPLVEGWLDIRCCFTAQEYLKPVLAQEVDTLVLGCTHYPLLTPLLQDVAGPNVRLIDSAQAMAERAAILLKEQQLGNPNRGAPRYEYFVTDVPVRFQTIGERFLGRTLANVHVVKW